MNELVNRDFDKQYDELSNQLSILDRRILSLQSHVITIENANQTIESMSRAEKDVVKKTKLHNALMYNIELLIKLYSCIREFDDVKYKYYKEIGDTFQNKYKLLLDIRRVDEKIDKSDSGVALFFDKLMDIMRDKDEFTTIKKGLASDPEYNMI